MYGDGKADSQFAKQFDADNNILKQGGINSKLAGDSVPTGGAINGVGTAASIAGSLTSTFRDQVMLHNNTQNTGTNKHNLEIALSIQPSIDLLLEQKAERDRAYTNFLSNLFDTELTVEINLSPITQAIMDTMEADVATAQAQAGGE